jgi:hypothetical protein
MKVIQHLNECFDCLYNLVWNISHSKENLAMYVGLHVRYRIFLSDFNKT